MKAINNFPICEIQKKKQKKNWKHFVTKQCMKGWIVQEYWQ